jgi:RNA polymerase sigma-70 factor, ECF subfamily
VQDGVTKLLEAAAQGQNSAQDQLLPLVYGQLRAIAQHAMNGERNDHTLQATALVHEAYLKLVGTAPLAWSSRAAFFHAASEAMRRILIDHARGRDRVKRGGGVKPVQPESLDSIGTVADLACAEDEILAFDEAFHRLEEHDARFAAVVRLRFYAGLSVEQTAKALGVSERTVNNDWTYARAWLARALAGGRKGLT